jgi:hypothetical protein
MNNCCCCREGFLIVQGDDTDALNEYNAFELETDIDLTGFTAVFQVENLQYTWNDITSKMLYWKFSREQTESLNPGVYNSALKIYDNNDRAVTVVRDIPVNVLPMVVDNMEE